MKTPLNFKSAKMLAICLTVLLVALTGCSSSYTEGVEGSYCKTPSGDIYTLEHRVGDLYAPIKVDVDELKNTLDKARNFIGN